MYTPHNLRAAHELDAIVIIDAYALPKYHPKCDIQRIIATCFALGSRVGFFAIVNTDNPADSAKYTQYGCQTIAMNGDRPKASVQFTRSFTQDVRATHPKQVVLITHEVSMAMLVEQALQNSDTRLQVWKFGDADEDEWVQFNPRQLVTLLPELRQARSYVFVDMENIWIGLQKRGWKGSVEQIVDAIKATIADKGEVVKMVFYADWKKLEQGNKQDLQRELAELGHETVYLVNRAGKNSVDLKLADDLHSLVQKPKDAPDAADLVIIVSGDLDLRVAAERARTCGKQVIIIGLQGSLSPELRKVATSVHFLEEHLAPTAFPTSNPAAVVQPAVRTLGLQVACWAEQNHWKFLYPDRLRQKFGQPTLDQLLAAGILHQRPLAELDPNSQSQALVFQLNPQNPTAQGLRQLCRWLPRHIGHYLTERHFPYVDTAFLVRGMAEEPALKKLGLGQNRTEAEELLETAAKGGLVVKKMQPHPKNPDRQIATWWLPGKAMPQDTPPTVTPDASPASAEAGTVQATESIITTIEIKNVAPDWMRAIS